MRGLKQAITVLLVVLLAFGSPVSALAEDIGKPDTTVLSNGLVKITVNNDTGRFAIRTDGQPVRKKDQNINMMFKGMTRRPPSRPSGLTERIISSAILTSSLQISFLRSVPPYCAEHRWNQADRNGMDD